MSLNIPLIENSKWTKLVPGSASHHFGAVKMLHDHDVNPRVYDLNKEALENLAGSLTQCIGLIDSVRFQVQSTRQLGKVSEKDANNVLDQLQTLSEKDLRLLDLVRERLKAL